MLKLLPFVFRLRIRLDQTFAMTDKKEREREEEQGD